MTQEMFPETVPDERLTEGLKELRREISMRQQLYPKWVAAGRMKQEVADRQLGRLKGLLEYLEGRNQ